MDVRQYFNEVDFSSLHEKNTDSRKYSLGYAIEKSTVRLNQTNLQKVDAVIFGVPCFNEVWDKSTDRIRKELYSLAALPEKPNIVDFGDLKPPVSTKGTYFAIRDLVEVFAELNIVTIILGGSSDLCAGICEAFKNEKFFTLSSIDAQLDVKKGHEDFNSSTYLTWIFKKMPNLFQFNLLGYQRHLIAPELFRKNSKFGNHFSLGEIHDDIKKTEPVLRNTNVLAFDIKSVKHAEIAGSGYTNPSGLQSNEVCQLAKYAGMSSNIKVFGLFDDETKTSGSDIAFKLVAQAVWYFLEGLIFRKNDYGANNEKVLTYKVEINGMEKPLKFLFCENSERWWFEIQSLDNETHIIACSEAEYHKALNNEIPDLWLNYVRKIDRLIS